MSKQGRAMVVCPLCGYTTPATKGIQFCPRDQSLLRPSTQAVPANARAQSAFDVGWERMSDHLQDPQTFRTLKQQKPFEARYLVGGDIEVTPLSTGNTRLIHKDEFRRIHDQWARSRSYRPGNYSHRTRNSAYIITLIKAFFDQGD